MKPGAVVISSIVIADRGVKTANPYVQEIAERIGEQQAFDIHAKRIVPPRFENNFTEELELFRDVRGDKEIELPETEGLSQGTS